VLYLKNSTPQAIINPTKIMSQKKIQTEEPDEHWSFLDFKDKVVLDLGCGKFYSSISTAQWFLNKGALKVIGVDLSKENIDNDRFISYAKAIRSTKDLEYFLKYEPEVIKCDIEGAEIYFRDIPSLPSVKQIAFEYHCPATKKVCEESFIRWGFENIVQYQLFNESTDRIGVYYAFK
jgi:SAM-dependent methyltransferase